MVGWKDGSIQLRTATGGNKQGVADSMLSCLDAAAEQVKAIMPAWAAPKTSWMQRFDKTVLIQDGLERILELLDVAVSQLAGDLEDLKGGADCANPFR